ncbi:MAG TPA: type II toxin-antitoxin system HicB family antitoxin [Nitrososphaera sp.]|jgi:predicted RNase H-like HicB family nuclease|nr:type II toxin-antitoxin system HicB family antitoxin [Nitrososphaera sp.]
MDFKKSIGKRKFTIRIQESAEGGYIGRCLELPGAISEAETLEELKSNMTEAIQLILNVFEQRAKKDKKMIIEIPG